MNRRRCSLGLACLLLVACGPTTVSSTVAPEPGKIVFPTPEAGVEQVEILAVEGGAPLLTWTGPADEGRDIWLATLEDGAFTTPVKVNNVPANELVLEEMRPSLAAGPDGRVAVARATPEWDIQVAVSDDGGRTFAPSVRVNGDQGEALQVLPVAGFDRAGGLHIVWLDPRDAPPQAEEPADLYHARIEKGVVTEQNLTAVQESSVCGCCRPHLQIGDDDIVITFRNTTSDVHRDPFQLTGTFDGVFGGPEPSSPPTWKINACPIAGPVGFDREVVWFDGSAGHARILAAHGPESSPQVLLDSVGEVRVSAGPREVTGWDRAGALLPALPSSRLFVLEEGVWSEIADDLPNWSRSAAVHQGRLIVVGAYRTELMHQVRALPG